MQKSTDRYILVPIYFFLLTGGSEINPSSLMTDFDTIQGDEPWEFNPHGHIRSDICTHSDKSMFWDSDSGIRSLTTQQMIVQYGYMLQFEVWYSVFYPGFEKGRVLNQKKIL